MGILTYIEDHNEVTRLGENDYFVSMHDHANLGYQHACLCAELHDLANELLFLE